MKTERCITLRIKQDFFNGIKAGKKKIEYRDAKPFYTKLFSEMPTHLLLHYQGKENLKVEVKGLKIIDTPRWLQGLAIISGFNFSDKVYEIKLGKLIPIT